MVVKTPFSSHDFANVLAQYELGTLVWSEAVPQGAVQTNFFLHTNQGKFVFRYYENRSRKSVLFESDLIAHLTKHLYPCPSQIKNRHGSYVGMHRNKPYAIFEFIQGRHVAQPNAHHQQQLIQKAAELQKLTKDFHSDYTTHRSNYGPARCRTLARAESLRINTKDSREKYAWLADVLTTLNFPPSCPKTICHCDFHFTNVLFRDDQLVALLDFDDANYTFSQFDLVGLIEYGAWPHDLKILDLEKARQIVQEYEKHRPLNTIEQETLFDVYQLSILFDCVWFFARGSADDFYEKWKIDTLTHLGRARFIEALFGK